MSEQRPPFLQCLSFTWNVAELDPLSYENEATVQRDLSQLLQFGNDPQEDGKDLYVMAFQEIEMNTVSMIQEQETSMKKKWEQMVRKTFSKQFRRTKYMQIASYQLVGLLLLIYTKFDYLDHINDLEVNIQREGFASTFGNKGSVAVRFELFGKQFCFINLHLTAHESNVEQRNTNLKNILSKTTFRGNRIQLFQNHDFIILLGDYNYRLSVDTNSLTIFDIIKQVEQRNFSFLLSCEQLTNEMKRGKILNEFEEGALQFPPTYKFVKGTDRYYDKKSNRLPSWTDRIFYWKNTKHLLQQVAYNRTESQLSDHKPVYSVFHFHFGNATVGKALPPVPQKIPPPPPKHLLKEENLIDFTSDHSSSSTSVSTATTNGHAQMDFFFSSEPPTPQNKTKSVLDLFDSNPFGADSFSNTPQQNPFFETNPFDSPLHTTQHPSMHISKSAPNLQQHFSAATSNGTNSSRSSGGFSPTSTTASTTTTSMNTAIVSSSNGTSNNGSNSLNSIKPPLPPTSNGTKSSDTSSGNKVKDLISRFNNPQ